MLNSSVLRKGLQTVAAGMSPQVAQNMAQERSNQASFERDLQSGMLEQQIAMAQQMPDDDPRKMQIVSGIIQQLEPIAPTVAEGLKRSLPSIGPSVPTGFNPQGQPQLEGQFDTVAQRETQAPAFGAFGESQKARETRIEKVRLERQREAVLKRLPELVQDPDELETLTTLAENSDDPTTILKSARDLTKDSTYVRNADGRVKVFDKKSHKEVADLGAAPGGQKFSVTTPDGTTVEFGDVAPDSRIAKAFEDVEQTRTSGDQMVAMIGEMRDLVSQPQFAGGTVGDIISGGNSLMNQIGNVVGLDRALDPNGVVSNDFIDPNSSGAKRLREAAINGDRLSALQLQAAYVMSKSLDPGGRISDADVKAAKQMFGVGGDPKSRLAVLDDLEKRVKKNVDIFVTGKQRLFPNDQRFNNFKYGDEPKKGEESAIEFDGMTIDDLMDFDQSQLSSSQKEAYSEALRRALSN
jgi:hypothetical protein